MYLFFYSILNTVVYLFNECFTMYTYYSVPLHFFSGFLFPASEGMKSIVSLYSELILVAYIIIASIIYIVFYIIDHFHWSQMIIPGNFRKNHEITLDCFFLLIPTTIIIYLLGPTLGLIYQSEFNIDLYEYAITFNITGHQWYWTYGYSFDCLYSSNIYGIEKIEIDSIHDPDAIENKCLGLSAHLVIPQNLPIELQVTSEDVIHSWAVPQLGVKLDAVPGKMHSIILIVDTIGVFYGQCSELCGAYHGFMPIGVDVCSPRIAFIQYNLLFNNHIDKLLMELHCAFKE